MKKWWIIGLFLVNLRIVMFADEPVKQVHCEITDASGVEFIKYLSEQSGIPILFKKEWLGNSRITLYQDSICVIDALQLAFSSQNLVPSNWNNSIVLLPEQSLFKDFPVPVKDADSSDLSYVSIDTMLTTSEQKYLTGRSPQAIKTLIIGKAGSVSKNKKVHVQGRMIDAENGEPLYFASVHLKELQTGALTDQNGYFMLNVPVGKYNASFNFLGYQGQEYYLEINADGEMEVGLHRAVFQIDELVIVGDRQSSMAQKDPGLDKITMRSIKELPMLMGERDILRISETLPGIVTVGEGTSGLNVRGGGSDQNAFYMNKIPIYNTSHLFGFFSAFNSDIIKDFSIFKGYVPANYGGRLSSVFNIITRQGNRKNFTAHGGVSPMAANLVVEGPLVRDVSSFILSARTSYSDWILRQIDDPEIRSSKAGFSDFAAGINYDLQKVNISVFGYYSKDNFKLSDISDYRYTNGGMSFNIGHNISKVLRGEYSLIGSSYQFNTINTQELSSSYQHGFRLADYELRADFKHVLLGNNTMDYGLSLVFNSIDRGIVEPYGNYSVRKITDLGSQQGLESAVYLMDNHRFGSRLTITGGFRLTIYTPMGPGVVYSYQDGKPMEQPYIVHSTKYNAYQVIRWYTEPDIRAAINYQTDELGSVKLGFNQMHQNLYMLNNTISVSPNAQWNLADAHIVPSRSNQMSVGVYRSWPQLGLEYSAELYYKWADNVPVFKDGADFIENAQIESSVLQGEQKSYGVEFYVKRSRKRIEGWLSYTYARSLTTVNGSAPWFQINAGEVFPSDYDIPHVLNMVLNYHLSRRISFSTIITYQSGKPVTYPISVFYTDGIPIFDYSKRNAYRMPEYFRVDLSMTIEGGLQKNKFLHSSFNVSVYNLTGRENPYSIYFTSQNGWIKSYQYSVIGVPILTATWTFKLGNYASD